MSRLHHDPVSLTAEHQRVSQIRLDIVSGNYDLTLAKYTSDRAQLPQEIGAIDLDLFGHFIEWKTTQVQIRTLEKHRGLVTWKREYLGDRLIDRSGHFFPVAIGDSGHGLIEGRLGLGRIKPKNSEQSFRTGNVLRRQI